MRNVIDNAKKHWKNLSIHLKKHHKKYLFGAFGWFALVKIFFLLLWLMPVTNIKNIFADYNEWIILDSNNLETYCEISEQETDITCNYDTARNVNIIGVNPWAFNNYKHTLLNLNLSGNKIQSIESWTFTELTRLQLVILDNNQIYHISAEDFIWLNENFFQWSYESVFAHFLNCYQLETELVSIKIYEHFQNHLTAESHVVTFPMSE